MSNKTVLHVVKFKGKTFCGLNYAKSTNMEVSKSFLDKFLGTAERWCKKCTSDPMCVLRDRL